jgi:hypothetical protein
MLMENFVLEILEMGFGTLALDAKGAQETT